VEVPGVTRETHYSVLPLITMQGSRLGAYLAPEVGFGGGYTSVMAGGGLSLRVLSVGRAHLRVLAGYTSYTVLNVGSLTADVDEEAVTDEEGSLTDTFTGPSYGALLTVRLTRRVRLAARAQQVRSAGEPVQLQFKRYSFGLVF
jgi:hypothetical protein